MQTPGIVQERAEPFARGGGGGVSYARTHRFHIEPQARELSQVACPRLCRVVSYEHKLLALHPHQNFVKTWFWSIPAFLS
jgi:hypothetical protein